MKRFWRKVKRLLGREDAEGQGLVEYAMVIAFVGVLLILAFSIKGALMSGISSAYSSCTSELNALNQAASSSQTQ